MTLRRTSQLYAPPAVALDAYLGARYARGLRLSVVTPKPRSLPALTFGAISMMFDSSSVVCPPTVDIVAGAPPL